MRDSLQTLMECVHLAVIKDAIGAILMINVSNVITVMLLTIMKAGVSLVLTSAKNVEQMEAALNAKKERSQIRKQVNALCVLIIALNA